MKFSTTLYIISVAVFPLIANAIPSCHTDGSKSIDDNPPPFGLFFAQLIDAFYDHGLAKYSEDDFTFAGHPAWVRSRYEQISAHKKRNLESIARDFDAVELCKFEFNDTDVNSFVDTSYFLSSLRVSELYGAIANIKKKAYLTTVASILGVEARHASWINSAIRKANPWDTAFEVPISRNQAQTLLSEYVTSCPASSPFHLAKAHPSLTISAIPETYRIKLSWDAPKKRKHTYAAFVMGTGTTFVAINDKTKEVGIPKGLRGLVYVSVTKNNKLVADNTTIAGPALMEFPFDSRGRVY